jgi:hypothetical protein
MALANAKVYLRAAANETGHARSALQETKPNFESDHIEFIETRFAYKGKESAVASDLDRA